MITPTEIEQRPGSTVAIRPMRASDIGDVKRVIDSCGLFPSEMLDDMVGPHLAGLTEQEIWLVADDSQAIAVAYCAPERMTQGTWNLLLIAVRSDQQGKRIGSALMAELAGLLAARQGRLLLVETGGNAAFEGSRSFYRRLGFEEEARIRDFYDAGEDKIVFWRRLNNG